MSVTIKEIARVAGVTPATVSRALNDKPGVSRRVRARIARIAEELGYVPDPHARALVTGRVPFVGLVVPDITNPYYPLLARGVEEAAFEAGISVLLVNTDWRADRLRQAVDLLVSRRVAGLVIAVPLERGDARVIPWTSLPGPVVLIGRDAPPGADFPSLEVNNHHGGLLVGRHLLARGWRRLAYLGGAPEDRPTRERGAGLRDALAAGPGDAALVAESAGAWTVDSGDARMTALWEAGPRPDAVFAANDLIAIGAARAMARLGLCPGRDLGLVGYDDIPAARYLEPALTTIAQPTDEMGRRAARILFARLDGDEHPEPAAVEPRLVVRQSCGHERN